MYTCERCHAGYECPAGKHERLYWTKCELCGEELNCFDCVTGPKRRNRPATQRWGIDAYLNSKRLRYRRGE